MLLRITHDTHYRYQPDVEMAQHLAYLRPMDSANQGVCEFTLDTLPRADCNRVQTDWFGNTRHYFTIDSAHAELRVVAHSVVRTQAPASPQSDCTWEEAQSLFAYRGAQTTDPATEFCFASPYVPLHEDFARYASHSFTSGRSALRAAVDLTQRIHCELRYENKSTEVNTPALQALTQRKGVCQDFAHILVACLRTQGLPAQYVSGYVLTNPLPGHARLVGADASHAWASVYLPDLPEGQRWVDLDPTNNRWGWGSPGEDYVTVARGRDFGDISPLRGVIQGGRHHVLTVGVTVEPVDES